MSQYIKLFLPDVEWAMCSSEEAHQRQRFKELSPLECTASSYKAHPRDRIPDPNKCVKKYRRSAAGGGVDGHANGHGNRRSLDELEITVNYLLGIIFSTQKSSNEDNDRFSLLESVLFVDDRIRAVQVDLTIFMGQNQLHEPKTTFINGRQNHNNNNSILKIRNIQAKIVRYHLLSQYLLSTLTSKQYEWKFGHKALTTAISSYLATWDNFKNDDYTIDQEEKDIIQLDEIMSYTTLLHVASTIYSKEPSIQSYDTSASKQKWHGLQCEDGCGMASVLTLYRRYIPIHNSRRKKGITALSCFPKYQLAVRIAGDIDSGNYLSAIRLLTESESTSLKHISPFLDERSRWQILARCCMSQVMPALRIGLLRLYNKSFMKQEKVKDDDVRSGLLQKSIEILFFEYWSKIITTFLINMSYPYFCLVFLFV